MKYTNVLCALLWLIGTACCVLKHKHAAELLVFSQDFKKSAERLKSSDVWLKTNARASVSLNRISENLFCKNLHFTNNNCSYTLRQKASYIPICCISHLCRIPKSWCNNQYLKKKRFKKKNLNWMGDLKLKADMWSSVTSWVLLLDVKRLFFTDHSSKNS